MPRSWGSGVSTISGGSLRNAIPRESFAVIVLPAANETKLQAAIKEAEGIYKAELNAKEPTLQVIAEATEIPAFVIDTCTQFRVDQCRIGLSERHRTYDRLHAGHRGNFKQSGYRSIQRR